MLMARRSLFGKIIDFLTFPIRSITLFENDKWCFSSLRSERFDYVVREVIGYCLDVGCGRNNIFIKKYLNNNGKGIDVFPYEGLTKENVIENISRFPFKNSTFSSVTFIANINHVPKKMRGIELKEAYRCLKSKGNIIITMGNPLAEILVHKVVHLYDKMFKTTYDMDSERGMHEDEEYFLVDEEIKNLLVNAKFKRIRKKYFITQWGLNHMFIAWK